MMGGLMLRKTGLAVALRSTHMIDSTYRSNAKVVEIYVDNDCRP
jgi:hypothetical protein